MPLNIKTEGTCDFLRIIKYDARAGRMIRVDRTQGTNGWDTEEIDITDDFTGVFDFDNAEEGHLAFINGRPDFVMVLVGEAFPDQPSEGHRHAFRIPIYSKKLLGGLREFSHTAVTVTGVFKALYETWETAPERGNGKVAVVRLAGTTAKKINVPGGGQSTVYVPGLVIEKWIDRPDALGPVRPRNGVKAGSKPEAATKPDNEATKPAPATDDVADDDAPEF